MNKLALILTATLAATAFAQEGVEEKLKAMRKEAAAAKEAGRFEDAEKIHRAAQELQHKQHGEKPKGPSMKEQVAEMEKHLAAAKEAGRGEEAEKIARTIEEFRRQHAGKKATEKKEGGEAESPEARLKHLGEAIRHLRAAGMHEPAEHLTAQAHKMKEHIAAGGHGASGEGRNRDIEELRQAVKNLERQLHEVRTRLEHVGGK